MIRSSAVLFMAAVSMSCRSPKTPESPPASSDTLHQDLARLGRILRWGTMAPRSATYRIQVLGTPGSRVPGPTDWSMEAILRYDSATFARLVDSVGPIGSVPGDSGPLGWDWLDSVDRRLLEAGPIHPKAPNSVFPSEACPNGTIQPVEPGLLLVHCWTR